MKVEGKVAIVTGGASGLGKATAEALVAAGAKVMIWDMNEEKGREVALQLGENARFRQNICQSSKNPAPCHPERK